MDGRFDGIAEFVATARLGSFTAAGVELGLTKSAIGRAVSRLEARLGTILVHRTTRRLTLTADGEAWLHHCMAALDELGRGEDTLSTAQHVPSGQVRIDLPSALGRLFIMPSLLGLAARYPALKLNVSFTDRLVDLIGEGIDLAVRIARLEDTPDLVAHPLGVQRLAICGSPGYLAVHGKPSSPDALAQHDCLVGWRPGHNASWLLKDQRGATIHHVIPVKHEIADHEVLLAAARAGSGLAQLPLWLVADDLRSGRLASVLDGVSGGEVPVNILWPRRRTVPARMRVVIDEIAKAAGEFSLSSDE